ncbi:MAG: hypothetical protein RIB59_05490 [Rhodospirillales bacterium]
MKKSIATIALLSFIIGAGLTLMEVGTRIAAPQQLVRGFVLPDPDLGSILRPNINYRDLYGGDFTVTTNRQGFRMPEDVDFRPSRKRVIVYGDSFTFGWGVEYKDAFFAQIKKKLEQSNSEFQLINAGIGGYSTGHVKKLFERHIPSTKPAALIYFLNNNDLIDNVIRDIDYRVTDYKVEKDGSISLVDKKVFAPWKRFLLTNTPYGWLNQNSHLFVLSKDLLKRALSWKRERQMPQDLKPKPSGQPAAPPRNAETLRPAFTVLENDIDMSDSAIEFYIQVTRAHVKRLAEIAERHRIPLLVVWIPSWSEMFAPNTNGRDLLLFNKARKMLFALAKDYPLTAFADTTSKMPRGQAWAQKRKKLHFDDGHFNIEGNAWFARHVLEDIALFVTGGGK